jgi:hypothetical protein
MLTANHAVARNVTDPSSLASVVLYRRMQGVTPSLAQG